MCFPRLLAGKRCATAQPIKLCRMVQFSLCCACKGAFAKVRSAQSSSPALQQARVREQHRVQNLDSSTHEGNTLLARVIGHRQTSAAISELIILLIGH